MQTNRCTPANAVSCFECYVRLCLISCGFVRNSFGALAGRDLRQYNVFNETDESVARRSELFHEHVFSGGASYEALFVFGEVTAIYTGAVIVSAGLGDKAMLPAGKLSVVERMVSVFRKAGTDMIVVVTKPDDKPLEKQLSQYGVMFLRSKSHISREASARVGLEYLSKKCRRIFLIDMDRPLLSPDTLNRMLSHEGELIVPFCKERPGKPLLFSAVGARKALEQTNPMLDVLHLPVDDDGILLTASDAQDMTDRYKAHNAMITGISLDLSIHCGRQIVDKKLISLLYLIDETQSVREACSRMQISYSSAWNMLNQAESELDFTLVHRNKGGASGSGSVLTDKGNVLLRAYLEFEAEVRSKAEKLYEHYFEEIT